MDLLEVIGVTSVDEVDPTRPLSLGALELGVEAAVEAVAILNGGQLPSAINVKPTPVGKPFYWNIAHSTEGYAECFGFPSGATEGMPTAIEVALVRAIAVVSPGAQDSIMNGDAEIAIGPNAASFDFRKVLEIVAEPLAGNSLLFDSAAEVIVYDDAKNLLSPVCLKCLSNSLRSAPLKFRFLELYRLMEARFLAEIKTKLDVSFTAEPKAALSYALEALKSEMNQIIGLAETQKDAFEACWSALDQLKNTNRFVAALFRKIKNSNHTRTEKWATGAALIYNIRCAVVHAGEKDMIFENFTDGEIAIESVMPHVERAALLLMGIEIL